MAMKKRAAAGHPAANDDTVIYKVMIALGILCAAILGLRLVRRYYGTADGMPVVRAILGWCAIAFALAAVVLFVLGVVRGKQLPRLRSVCFSTFWVMVLFAVSALVLRRYWVSPVPYLYFVFIAATVLYMIYLLYQMEFLLLSLANVCAGMVFYALSHLYPEGLVSLRSLALNGFLILVLLVVTTLSFLASQNDGKLKWKEKFVRLFQPRFSPLPLYLTALIWLLCLIASALLGTVFAYYCVFAVAAWELIFAVYYTFKLS